MKNATSSRIAAALMSTVVTLMLVNGVALYGHPDEASDAARLAARTPIVVAFLTK